MERAMYATANRSYSPLKQSTQQTSVAGQRSVSIASQPSSSNLEPSTTTGMNVVVRIGMRMTATVMTVQNDSLPEQGDRATLSA